MLPAVQDRIVYGFKYLQRILGIIISAHNSCIETGAVACMAGSANLFHFCKQSVIVAVNGKRLHILEMSGSLALHPLALPAPAVIGHPAGLHRMVEGLLVHICHHKYFIRLIILYNNRDQTVRIQFEL